MAGTKAGGQAAAATNMTKYGVDYYAKIGAKGGSLGRTGGFFANRELAREAGRIGGRKSRRQMLTAKETAILVSLRNTNPQAWNYRALSRKFGIAESTVYKYLVRHRKEHGVPAPEHERNTL